MRRMQRPGTSAVAWVSIGSFGVWILVNIVVVVMVLNLARTGADGVAASDALLVFLLLVVGGLLAPIVGLIAGIVGACAASRPKGVAITGLVLNGLVLLYIVVRFAVGVSG